MCGLHTHLLWRDEPARSSPARSQSFKQSPVPRAWLPRNGMLCGAARLLLRLHTELSPEIHQTRHNTHNSGVGAASHMEHTNTAAAMRYRWANLQGCFLHVSLDRLALSHSTAQAATVTLPPLGKLNAVSSYCSSIDGYSLLSDKHTQHTLTRHQLMNGHAQA